MGDIIAAQLADAFSARVALGIADKITNEPVTEHEFEAPVLDCRRTHRRTRAVCTGSAACR
jgi:hypothetical protein